MGKIYDITFHTLDGNAIIKRGIYSEKNNEEIWKDAVERFNDKQVVIRMNKKTLVCLNRKYIVRIDITKIANSLEKAIERKDEFQNVVNTFSEMGI